ncbi:uncharacterized protein DUF1311 [Paraburkholderia bryophila]|jgi:uncharacterized protein YecT (DUF1311 family)|uniref:Uncharacterized protein DUF1311 n=2 Tax=Paraburkholderia bryophila TaxID=420952 RepID=A0A329C1X6_9BURK|nr:uncharacterized protein DUF1311 [Paraburkholderia bryophila]
MTKPTLRLAKLAILSGFAFFALGAQAKTDCDASNLNRDQQLACAQQQTAVKAAQADKLYQALRRDVPEAQRDTLQKNLLVWTYKVDTDCALQRDAFNDWGKNPAPDAEFQYEGCKAAVRDEQVSFYESLICPDSLETGDKASCGKLSAILRSSD